MHIQIDSENQEAVIAEEIMAFAKEKCPDVRTTWNHKTTNK